ncbi:MAG: hypothetical protein GYB64_00415 [Chloroflexi bacterium]|nr:hypothetical protein [Chloroflexota bacterium]
MDLFRYDAEQAQTLPDSANTTYIPVRQNGRMTAMILKLDRKGDTGKREVPADTLLTVVSGEGNVRSGGSVAELQAGDIVTLTGSIPYQIWTSSELVVVLMMPSNAG